ncbi:helicase-exonuclease AddAB subunit AddA [Lactobacillus psittaci]|uniref:ATP-dependent helicase/nuclease subunit A n=1 Tax=Lactobacillus psittaci DSM 15354 TaxID=1122152 RepID=A0A0R1S3L0_9LACO|nr:helicase-exonuclease AddAB subunit AddA [Lactobacillus psittaci]KRL63631.1 recombination helicase AddA [Lactobacillus psittaci DSM 15354]
MVNYTQEQNAAISEVGKNLLVSASAGSGKTMVLVERVLNLIKNGTSLDELLVITFTKAAATEMKERIQKVLRSEIQKKPQNISLRQELIKVETSNISTIDSFCLDVVRRFYYVIGLDPSFSVLTDETQSMLLKEKALKEVEKTAFTESNQDLINLYNNFSGDRDAQGARELIFELYNYAMARPEYDKWLKNLAQDYETSSDLTQTPFFRQYITPYLEQVFNEMHVQIQQLCDHELQATELEKVLADFQAFDQKLRLTIQKLKEANFNQLRATLHDLQFTGSYRKSSKWDENVIENYQIAQTVKKNLKEQIADLYAKFFVLDNDDQTQVMKKAGKLMQAAATAELEFIKQFNQLKRAQNLLDYSDMEQLAYQILTTDTSAGHLAKRYYQNHFKEILVDEYQDTNALQESLIGQISAKGQNSLFMVGDVKQSIYGFRQADPSLFLQKYYEYSHNPSAQSIVLADNFRSTKAVTKTVNQIFNPLMTTDFGGIDYQDQAQLKFGASYYPQSLASSTEFIYHLDNDDDSSQIQVVIDRIKQLIKAKTEIFDVKLGQKRPIKYSDIVILTRSRSQNLDLLKAFSDNKIPLFVGDVANYFQTFELTVIMNFLKIIDNPDQDIPLVAVLRSPLFNFKEPDLAKIRINSPNASFYQALLNYLSLNDDLAKSIKKFLNQLGKLREFATNHRLSELIWSIFEQTSLLEIVTSLPNGQQRRVNLENLYERANSYESAGFKGLYQFINFINRMRKNQKDLAQPLLSNEAENSVQLMTIHASKGLEFPIVFYFGLEHRFQKSELSANYIIFNNNCGLTVNMGKYRADSLVRAFGEVQKKRSLIEEESRIMYVALTRARQKLIMTTNIKDWDKDIQKWQLSMINGKLALNTKINANNALDLIAPSLHLDRVAKQKIADISQELDEASDFILISATGKLPHLASEEENAIEKSNPTFLTESIKKLYDWKYPFEDATKTTAYQAVSELKKAFNNPDPDETELENSHYIKSANRYLQAIDTSPTFLYKSKYTGAEIGTATHLILQYYDYQGAGDSESLKKEIDQLIQEQRLSADLAKEVDLAEIEWFVHSDFAKKFWEKPNNLKREISFSSLLKADILFKNFSDPDAKILVHGTIDGYYLDKDGIILFDYKTDYVDSNNQDLAIAKIKEKYTGQLRLYERALNELGGQKVKEKYLVLLNAKKLVKIE